MNKLILGRYLPGDSLIYRLDPRGKFLITFYFIGIVFLANNLVSYAFLLLFVFFAVYISKVSISFFIKGLRPMLWLILFTVLLQAFFTPSNHPIWHWAFLSLSKEGLVIAGYIFIRFILIIFISTLLTLTTTPIEISDSIESILKPLRVIKFPVSQVALMLSIALRFVPLLIDETIKIMDAQRARGVDFGEGGLIKRIKSFVPILIPLFVSSFSIAYDLAIAMESRGYKDGEGRTKYRILHWSKRDNITVVVMIAITVVLLFLRSYK
ncbi:energy-coupling factor transporter transmembrane component T family protein [Companilactobacillus mishanensis]|uniref:Energy-coupling factor transporter transmembrane protein EcfT n=1 Tax=Companilactobacillus mishanensis TaxID=2486008 RepID=A0A5P0ZH96_9LACO|nr:energy-coupling factor transporter transmembrane component T [Companilactobacillus mishanensis]MQS52437.1 energy-coupling factor transporter transmembrane protein EcfT [Companilactobacillus mishanensis]MQS89399.1 energy-coupling factor transporter transmembrane protein EcfT [Companilactobacillus mishanensis]